MIIAGIPAYNEEKTIARAKVVAEEIGLNDVEISCTGRVDGGRGWRGNVKDMLLDVSKLKKLGWRSKHGSAEAVRLAVREMLNDSKEARIAVV